MHQTNIKSVSITELEYVKPCETAVSQCDNPATFAVWVDHHAQGCDYNGFRCDIHRNLLQLEVQRHVDSANAGLKTVCLSCGERTLGGKLSDHFRWVRI